MSFLYSILSLIMNMTASDDSNIEYLLKFGLESYLYYILDNNTPDIIGYSLEIDTILSSIMINLVHSLAFDYGFTLLKKEGLLERYCERITHKDSNVRKEAIILLSTLLRYQNP